MEPISMGILAVSAIGGIVNLLANKSATDRAEMLNDRALQEWIKINIPDPEQQRLVLEQFVVQGKLDPQLEAAISADPSQFKNIVTSAENKTAQKRALSQLEDIGNHGGMRLQDEQALNEAMLETNVRERGNRHAISDNMAQRGLGGSGFEFASQLQAQQSAADRDSRAGLSAAASAQDRALKAIMEAGNLGTQYRNQEFNEKAQKATAADRINAFNTENLRSVQRNNVGAINRGEEMNLAAQQNNADRNVNNSNFQQQHNKGLLQQEYNNKTRKVAGMAGQYDKAAANEIQAGANTGKFASNMAGGVNDVLTEKRLDDHRAAKTANDTKMLDEYIANNKRKKKDGLYE